MNFSVLSGSAPETKVSLNRHCRLINHYYWHQHKPYFQSGATIIIDFLTILNLYLSTTFIAREVIAFEQAMKYWPRQNSRRHCALL